MKSFGEIADEVGIFEGSVGYGKYIVSRESIADFYAAIVIEHNAELEKYRDEIDELGEQIYDSISKIEARNLMNGVQQKLDELFRVAMIGSCTCLNKAPDEYYHQPTCRFKILSDIYKRPVTGE